MKIIGLITVIISLFVFIGGIIDWVVTENNVWPYLLIPIGPFIWGLIQLTKHPLLTSLKPTDIPIFQKENCIGCVFADEEAMKKKNPWCQRPEPPEWDPKHLRCLMRQITSTLGNQTDDIVG